MLVNQQRSHFYAEFIARTRLSSVPKSNILRPHLLPKSCFFLFQNLVLLLRQALSLLYQNKIPCQAFPSSLLPEPKVKLLFSLARHRNKIKLIVPRRQTVLRNSLTRPATPCARPKDLQIANWKPLDTSDWRSRILRKRVGIALTPPKGN
ncbi:hypothetical protein AVEN_87317-1 [Araneus ventricosus]|uniref:Uncharacterized protein n=1 Tax=Araneus ventricosus TaxID=182803 RepID=A0A4Y2JQF0_ARAVE|nr:hypothetical protein AVEN_87317-1 [Araneus ventricosus]